MPVTPVTLVTGFLAAGKTTAIRQWCSRRPASERWAVLVNDFGHLAIDAAAHAGVEVFEVAGGCACCAASVAMRTTLGRILRRGPWDRLLVELSGLGHPSALIDLLLDAGRSMPLRLDGVVALVDGSRPGPWLDAGAPYRELARAQVEAADLVLLNRPPRPSCGSPAEARATLIESLGAGPFGSRPVLVCEDEGIGWDAVLDALRQSRAMVSSLSVPSVHGEARGGREPSSALRQLGPAQPGGGDMPTDSAPMGGTIPIGVGGGGRRWTMRTDDGFAVAWQWPADTVFDRRRLLRWTERVGTLPGLLRAKGVFRTSRDWYFWQHVPVGDTWESSGWRRDLRIECLFADVVEPGALERDLIDALDADAGTGGT